MNSTNNTRGVILLTGQYL